jgi:hypothetical protein
MADRSELILQEVAARAQQRLVVADLVKAIRLELFDKQLAVLDDPDRQKSALCSRRAGKTSLWARASVICALERPRSLIRIWAVSALRAKQLVWDEILRLCARHKIENRPNETTLTLKFPNGSEIRLLGADKQKEAEKKRGDKTAMEIIIESQLFGPYLETIVDDIAGPCLADLNGTFYLEGTPGPVCAGHWYSISGGNDTASRWMSQGRTVQGQHVGAGWSCHRWSALDNPFPNGKKYWRDWIATKKFKMRWANDNPTYLREWLGRWVNDFDALFYAFDPIRNTFDPSLPGAMQPWGPGWLHTLGWDLGFHDDMALVAWGFHPSLPDLYEAFSWKKPGASADEVIEQIVALERRGFNLTKMVADTGGGGRMYVEEVMKRYPYSFDPAKKADKYDHVRLLNDELRTGFVKLMYGSPYALEMAELPKAAEPDDDKAEKAPKEDPRFANHCCDAGLYAFRGSMHYLHRDVVPDPRTRAAKEEVRFVQRLENRRATDGQTWLERYDVPSSTSWDDE